MAIDQNDPATQAAFLILLRQLKIYVSSMFAIVCWEFILTVRSEIDYVWPSSLTVVKVCFMINRYLTFAFMVFMMVCSFAPISPSGCIKIHRLQVRVCYDMVGRLLTCSCVPF